MKLFDLRGGVHPEGRKDLSAEISTRVLPLPKLLYVPLQQHIGAPATPIVKVGDHVTITLPDNSTTPGIITSVGTVAVTPPSSSGSRSASSASTR